LPPTDDATVNRVLHEVHVLVGTEMVRIWNLPASLGDPATHHHDAAVAPGEQAGTIHLVRLMSALDLIDTAPEIHPRAAAEALQSARALGLSPAKLATLVPSLETATEWVRMLFMGGGTAES
jgi:HD-like signal output (HDOD) protein